MAASLTTGRTNGTWSISCSDPCPQRNAGARPPSTTIGEWFCSAEAIALMPLVTPGPAVSAATPGSRVTFAQPSAANAAVGLVAGVDDLDALVAAALVDREQVAAGEREQAADAVRLQPPGDEAAAVRPGGLVIHGGAESIPPGRGVAPPAAADRAVEALASIASEE